jgi:hypothetical protein
MMIRNENTPTLDDVLNEFVAEYERPTSEALEMWVGRYPQFRRELIDFAAAWAEQIALPETPELTAEEEERIVDRVMSHALNVSFGRDGKTQTRQPGENAISSLTGEAKNAGMSVADLAKGCGLDLVLVTKLNNRQILPETIPSRLVSYIARLVGRTAESVMEYLGGPPQLLSGVSFMAKKKPRSFERESFAEAVRASSLREAEKARWLDNATEQEEP